MSNSAPHHISYRWTFYDFSSKKIFPFYYVLKSTRTCTSSAPTPAKARFDLNVYLQSRPDTDGDNKDFLFIDLVPSTDISQNEKRLVRCNFSLIDSEGQRQNCKEFSYCFSNLKSTNGDFLFISKSDLLNPASGLINDDKLIIDCQITFLGEPVWVGYFDSFVPDLSFIAKDNPTLMMKLFQDLALKHRLCEFVDRVPLNLPALVPLEESMTQRVKFYLEISNLKIFRPANEGQWDLVCADTEPVFKFRVHRTDREVSISYLSTSKISVKFSVTFLNNKDSFERINHFSCEFPSKTNFINTQIFYHCGSTKYPYSIGRMDIRLEMTIYKKSSRKFDFPEMKSLSRRQTLTDLKTLVDCGKHCDVWLLVEGKQFRTSKAVLASLSPVFEAMFGHDMKQKFENHQVSLTDVSADVFEQFLHYLYTGTVSTQISLETVIELFQFSERYSTVELEQICLKFIVENCLKAINKDYLKIAAKFTPKLMMEILAHLAQQYRFNEFSDVVPLDLPFYLSLEETMTHHLSISNVKFCSVKKLHRKLGISEVRSLSRRQTLTDLKTMFHCGKHYDVALSVEGKQFRTSKAILASQSPVFEAINLHDMKQKFESHQVSLFDVSADVFEQFLHYIYSGKVSTQIALETVIELKQFSERYSTVELGKICFKFIVDHCLINKDYLQITAKFTPKLMMEILAHLAQQYRFKEFPDVVPLNLPFYLSLEETMTHHLSISNVKFCSVEELHQKLGISKVKSLSVQQVLLNLKFMFNYSKYRDVTFLVNGKQFLVPKSILATQSTVFEAMFRNDMKEKFESQVSLFDVTVEAFEQFLKYLCTGKVSSSMKIMELFEIADKYIIQNLELLRQQCEHILCAQVTTKNAIEVLQFSERYSFDRLKRLCLSIIIDHCVEIVTKDSWKAASSKVGPTLLMDMFAGLALKYQQNELPSNIPLDLSCGLIPEETVTYWPMFNFSFESTLMEIYKSPVFYAKDLKFSGKFNSPKCCVSILYLSTEKIFVHLLATSTEPNMGRITPLKVLTSSQHFSRQLSAGSKSFDLKLDFYPIKTYNVINLKMTIYKESSWKSCFPKLKSLSRQQTLMHLKTMVACGKFCDVTLFVEGKQFRSSKAILAAQSPVFEAMFNNSDMNEKFENPLSLSDVTVEVFELFLNYLYTGKVSTQMDLETVIELFHFSERHSAVELGQICSKFVFDYCLEAIDKEYYLKIASKFTPKLMMKILDNLAQQFRFKEFPDCVPLNLPFDCSLDETVTHHAMPNLTFASRNRVKFGHVKKAFRKFQDSSELKSLSREKLLLDLKSMFEGGRHCDVVLLVEGKQFRAHKSILMNRSIVFEAMFRFDWKEKVENQVEVHDGKVQVFEQFMLYLYTGKVDSQILKIHAMDVFVLADMHYLSTLQEMCLREFGQSLTHESVAEQFELAVRLGLTEFKQVCTDYMNKTN